MQFTSRDSDIQTVISRIADGSIDLRPEFQRGDVWPISKKQRLIDSLLRRWVVPPVLLIISNDEEREEVLDGQQRLTAIADFVNDRFAVDGLILPKDKNISSLHGSFFSALPLPVRHGFLRSTLRMYVVSHYGPEEPAEIFYRLNQPTVLSPAEKRNAFYGPVREQIRWLVEKVESAVSASEDGQVLPGFSSSRMALDDVLARFVATIEQESMRLKVTSQAVDRMYRRGSGISSPNIAKVSRVVDVALRVLALPDHVSGGVKLNKATLYSWLLFLTRLESNASLESLRSFFALVELTRSSADGVNFLARPLGSLSPLRMLLGVFTDRASSRVADVSSVLLRDLVLVICWKWAVGDDGGSAAEIAKKVARGDFRDQDSLESELLAYIEISGWGEAFP